MRQILSSVLTPLTLVAACASQPSAPTAPNGRQAAQLTVTSKSFTPSREIPVDFSCDGAERSPELTWSSPPDGTKSFAIVFDDEDAGGGVVTHWIAYNIKGDAQSLPEGANIEELGGRVGANDFHRPQYNGPCPPKRELHRYVFHVFALDSTVEAGEAATKSKLYEAMNGHVLAQGALGGMFSH